MHEHIPDTSNTYVVITAEDLKAFSTRIAVWSAAGFVVALGYAYWWERGEDERKEEWRRKKRAKAIDAAMKAKKKAEKAAKTSQ